MIKKIIKRTFVVTFSILTVLLMLLALIDFDKSVAWNVGKIVFIVLFTLGMMLTVKWTEEWEKEKR